MPLWFFNKVVWFVLAAMLDRHGGHALALQHGGQNYFLLISCSTFDSYAQMCYKRYHIIFSTFSLKFKCKICVQREVIHNFKNHFGHVTIYELIHFKKMMRVWKTKSPLFCLRYDPLIVFWRQNHITFIFIKTMSHDLLVQMAYYQWIQVEWSGAFSKHPKEATLWGELRK